MPEELRTVRMTSWYSCTAGFLLDWSYDKWQRRGAEKFKYRVQDMMFTPIRARPRVELIELNIRTTYLAKKSKRLESDHCPLQSQPKQVKSIQITSYITISIRVVSIKRRKEAGSVQNTSFHMNKREMKKWRLKNFAMSNGWPRNGCRQRARGNLLTGSFFLLLMICP